MAAMAGAGQGRRSVIRRIDAGRCRWRVVVESWPEQDAWRGRLLFRPDTAEPAPADRETAPLLEAGSHEELLGLVLELPDDRLRRLLNSLG